MFKIKTLGKVACCLVISFATTQTALANKNINALGGCQGFIDFVEKKLSPAPSKYAAADVQVVLKGLALLDKHIQQTVINPGFLKFAKGNKAKAQDLHKQLTVYKKQVATAFQKKHPQHRMFVDFAISLNGCYDTAPLNAAGKAVLEKSVRMIITLAKKG